MKNFNIKKLLLFIPAIIYISSLIFFANKVSKIMIKFKFNDNFIHFVAYAVLAFLLYLPIKYNFKIKHKLLLALIITIAFAFLDELNQRHIKTRTFDYKDILFDFIGALTILIVIKILNKLFFLKSKKD